MRNRMMKRIGLFLLMMIFLGACGRDAGRAEGTAAGGNTSAAEQTGSPEEQAADATGEQEAETADAPAADAAGEQEAETADAPAAEEDTEQAEEPVPSVDVNGSYTSAEEVALYIHTFGRLPDNYITKREAEALGWNSSKGNLREVAPGKSIGGSRFGNYEGNLPEKDGRTYYECDIDYEGGRRNAKRIVYSNDGLVYYTEDHYNTFVLLYGEE